MYVLYRTHDKEVKMENSCLNSKVNKETISRIIIERITDALLNGELKPGDRLPADTEFAQMLGVGRNSVREAFKILEAFGVLNIERSEGIYICSEYTDGILDPLLYGIILEKDAREESASLYRTYLKSLLIMVIDRVNEEDMANFKNKIGWLRKYVSEGDARRIYAGVLEVNSYLAELTGNRLAVRLNDVLEKLCRKRGMEVINKAEDTGNIVKIIERYEQIAEWMEKQDKTALAAFLVD